MVSTLAATNSKLPMQVPEIPLDFITPGLKVKLNYEGPVRNPTSASLTFTYVEQVQKKEKTGEPTEREKFRAETARMAEDQARFREGLKTPEQRAAEHDQFMNAYWARKNRLGLDPTRIPGLVDGEGKKSSLKIRDIRPKRDEEVLQRKAEGSKPLAGIPPIVHEVLRSPGQPLGADARAFMEPRFGHDFSYVRVHIDSRSAKAAEEVNAQAFTVGRDLVFGSGQYAPRTIDGQVLLAHELTHVLQQESGLQAEPILRNWQVKDNIKIRQELPPKRKLPPIPSMSRLQRQPKTEGTTSLPTVDPKSIPAKWRATPPPPSGGNDVYVYRGFARNAATHAATVVREGEIGGILSRRIDAAHDAVFNQVGREPVLSGPESGGVVRVKIPANSWDELVRTNNISERGNYIGFSRQLNSSEIRVNSPEAGRLINGFPNEVLPPDRYYDFRTGVVRPSSPQGPPQSSRGQGTPPQERETLPPPGRRPPSGAPPTEEVAPGSAGPRTTRPGTTPGAEAAPASPSAAGQASRGRLGTVGGVVGVVGLGIGLVAAHVFISKLEAKENQEMANRDINRIEAGLIQPSTEILNALLPYAQRAATLQSQQSGMQVYFNITFRIHFHTSHNPEPPGLIVSITSYAGTNVESVEVSTVARQGNWTGHEWHLGGESNYVYLRYSIPYGSISQRLRTLQESTERLKSDTEIRNWLSQADPSLIKRIPTQEKIRLINRLLDGWLSNEDVQGIAAICTNVASSEELSQIRNAIQPRLSSIGNLEQRTRIRVFLGY